MTVTEIFKTELKFIAKSSNSSKFFFFILLSWIVAIPVKNSVYQICTIIIPLFSVYHAIFINESDVQLVEFKRKYRDFIASFVLILSTMLLSNALSDRATIDAYLIVINFLYRYIIVLFSLLFLYESKVFTLKTLTIFILTALALYALHGVYQVIFIAEEGESIKSILYSRNPYGLVMFTGLMTSFFSLKYINERGKNTFDNTLLWSLIFIFLTSILFSQSRSAWISSSLFLCIFGIVNVKFMLGHKKWFALILLLLPLLIFTNQDLATRMLQLINLNDAHRYEIWGQALTLIADKPFTGYGLIEYQSIGITKFAGTHNSILDILLHTGALGFIAFFITFSLTAKEIFTCKRYDYFASFAGLLLISQFNLSIISNKIYLSVLTIFLFFVLAHRASRV